jgi:hypothetical protein
MEEGDVTRPSRVRMTTPRDKPPGSKPTLLHLRGGGKGKTKGTQELQLARWATSKNGLHLRHLTLDRSRSSSRQNPKLQEAKAQDRHRAQAHESGTRAAKNKRHFCAIH